LRKSAPPKPTLRKSAPPKPELRKSVPPKPALRKSAPQSRRCGGPRRQSRRSESRPRSGAECPADRHCKTNAKGPGKKLQAGLEPAARKAGKRARGPSARQDGRGRACSPTRTEPHPGSVGSGPGEAQSQAGRPKGICRNRAATAPGQGKGTANGKKRKAGKSQEMRGKLKRESEAARGHPKKGLKRKNAGLGGPGRKSRRRLARQGARRRARKTPSS
jgi:hypothetical protein